MPKYDPQKCLFPCGTPHIMVSSIGSAVFVGLMAAWRAQWLAEFVA